MSGKGNREKINEKDPSRKKENSNENDDELDESHVRTKEGKNAAIAAWERGEDVKRSFYEKDFM